VLLKCILMRLLSKPLSYNPYQHLSTYSKSSMTSSISATTYSHSTQAKFSTLERTGVLSGRTGNFARILVTIYKPKTVHMFTCGLRGCRRP
jgi:hypothetical protein